MEYNVFTREEAIKVLDWYNYKPCTRPRTLCSVFYAFCPFECLYKDQHEQGLTLGTETEELDNGAVF